MVAALLAWAAGAAAAPLAAPAQVPATAPTGSTRLLDVPYLPQSEDLCGGAAMAMVLRYWGVRKVQPEDFLALVDRSASGIRTEALTADVKRRGWQAFPHDAATGATGEWIREQIDRGRPIVALVEVSANRYHYIVVVGWMRDRVIAHDPANAPFQLMSTAEFERAWTAAGRWTLLVLPGDGRLSAAEASPGRTSTEMSPATGACGPLIQNMVNLARTGQMAAAESGLLAATRWCPQDPAAWRELAGIRFLQSRWGEAASIAEHAAALEPGDEAGWDLVATSRFLNQEPAAALGAWNRIARPAVDLIRVEGVRRTRHPVVVAMLNLPPRSLLTPARLDRATRRLDELPSAAVTRLRYRPLADGLVEIEAVVVERPTLPRGVVPIVAAAGRALLQREVRVDAAAPTRSGELLTVAWRWWDARPRLAMSLAVPAVSWLPGVTTVEGSWERQSYATPAIANDERRRAGLSVADWASSALRWDAGVAFDRWADDSHLSADGAVDLRLAGDRVSIGVDAGAWAPVGSGQRFATGRVSSAWRSTVRRAQPSWSVAAGFTTATVHAPLDLWPGAGVGHARAPLLRAHPLLTDGVVSGEVFGRQLMHGTIEYQHPLFTSAAGTLQLTLFADTARAWHRLRDDDRSPIHADLGAGLRVAIPGKGGALRLDVARGMRDNRMAWSAGWQAPWPGRTP